MIKEFTPYSNLWITAHNWYDNIKKWLDGDFEDLDAVAAEKFVEDGSRILNGVIRHFK